MTDPDLDLRLSRFKGLISSSNSTNKTASPLQGSTVRLAGQVGCEIRSNEYGSYCFLETTVDSGATLGKLTLKASLEDGEISLASFNRQQVEGTVKLSNLLFFDLETTGLSGAGAVPFLVGIGQFQHGQLHVRQYLLPDFPDEAAMLEDVISEFSEDCTAVTYNGASFDMNFLTERLTLHRVTRKIPHAFHIDLLHTTRRLFRRRLRDCSLTNVERCLLGHERADDIPGFLVPSAYFSWLNDESSDELIRVLEHNRQDIVSLAYLLQLIEQVFVSDGHDLIEADDIHSLSRIFVGRKMNGKVTELLNSISQERKTPEMVFDQALACKRSGNFQSAISLWEALADDRTGYGFLCCLELAKYYEHKERNPSRAIRFAQSAFSLCPSGERPAIEVAHRLNRLQKKLSLS